MRAALFVGLYRWMTLPRRGSRITVIDGETYRWVVSGIDAPIWTDLIVERAEGRASRLMVGIRGAIVITPGLVARIVTAAVRGGWAPRERGGDLRCHLVEDRLVPYRFSGFTAEMSLWCPDPAVRSA